jgi:hypothetical protein
MRAQKSVGLSLAVSILLGAMACGGADPEATNTLPAGKGKADQLGQAQATIRFERGNWEPKVEGNLVGGALARLEYDRARFNDIVTYGDGSKDYQHGTYLVSKYHCYGYGCCELGFNAIGVHYRFDDGELVDASLDESNALELNVPQGAQRLEVFFDAPSFTVRSYYCACDSDCVKEYYDRSTPRQDDLQTWDSKYGQNYILSISQ